MMTSSTTYYDMYNHHKLQSNIYLETTLRKEPTDGFIEVDRLKACLIRLKMELINICCIFEWYMKHIIFNYILYIELRMWNEISYDARSYERRASNF